MEKLASVIINELNKGLHSERLKDIYSESDLDSQKARYINILNEYIQTFGDEPVSVFRAAGRTEVGGNHTDHQHGKVLASAVDMDIVAVAAPCDDGNIIFKSEGYESLELSLKDLSIRKEEVNTTAALIRGVAHSLKTRDLNIGGFKALAQSNVLSGSGLSSSAAVEILLGNIFYGLYNEGEPDPVMLAICGQEAENNYFGKPSGLMDQMGCSVGGLIHIDFKDNSNPEVTRVDTKVEDMGLTLCIVDTKGSHANLTPEYAAVTTELAEICGYFGKKVLREVPKEDFLKAIPKLRELAGDRAVNRAIHIYSDNERVDKLFKALKERDRDLFLDNIAKTGNSSFKYLQNVYPSGAVKNQEMALALALTEDFLKGEGACRNQGGGFAGTIQVFLPKEKVMEYKAFIEAVYGEGSCHILNICKYGGLRVI